MSISWKTLWHAAHGGRNTQKHRLRQVPPVPRTGSPTALAIAQAGAHREPLPEKPYIKSVKIRFAYPAWQA
jgi:hypothetical protein